MIKFLVSKDLIIGEGNSLANVRIYFPDKSIYAGYFVRQDAFFVAPEGDSFEITTTEDWMFELFIAKSLKSTCRKLFGQHVANEFDQ